MLKPGDPVHDFPIGSTSLAKVLEERAVALFFFPRAFTPGWTREAGEFRRHYQALYAKGAEVIGVSTDKQAANDRFARELDLPYRLVGDPDASIAKAYQAKWPFVTIARRTTYVIGRDRRVLMAFRSEQDVMAHVRHAAKVIGLDLPGS